MKVRILRVPRFMSGVCEGNSWHIRTVSRKTPYQALTPLRFWMREVLIANGYATMLVNCTFYFALRAGTLCIRRFSLLYYRLQPDPLYVR